MSYLLDANACIELLRGRKPCTGNQTCQTQSTRGCSLFSSEGRTFFGAFRSNNREQALAMVKEFLDNFQSLPFDDHAAEI